MFFPPFQQKLQILPDLPLQSLNLRKISLPKPPIWPKFSPIFSRNSVLKVLFFPTISSLSPSFFCAFPFFKPPFAALRAENLYQNKSWVPPGVCPLPSHWLRPWCKIGGKRVLLGMHIYKMIQNMMDTVGLLKERTWKTYIGVEGL